MIKPVMCKTPHNPPESYGDCVSACVGTLLGGDENVPNIFNGSNPEQSWLVIRNYLKSKGKYLALLTLDDPFEFMEENNPSIPYMLIGRTAQADHAVICRDGQIIHDPAWGKSELIGKASLGAWVIGLIGDLA